MFIGEPRCGDAAVLARNWPKQRPVADPAEPHPGLEQDDGCQDTSEIEKSAC